MTSIHFPVEFSSLGFVKWCPHLKENSLKMKTVKRL